MYFGVLAQAPNGPAYSVEGLVNAASGTAGILAPNTLATLYGTYLSFSTRGITPEDIRANILPTTLPGTGVRVLIANQPVNLYYVSPTQINLLIPSNFIAGDFKLQVVRDGRAGPAIPISLGASAAQIFTFSDGTAIATRLDGSIVDQASPAKPGEVIVIYATGLGRTVPDLPGGRIATHAAPLERMPEFRIYLNGWPLDPVFIYYVGITPGFGGLYQINMKLPENTNENPEIRIGYGDPTSTPGVKIAVKPLTELAAAPDPGA